VLGATADANAVHTDRVVSRQAAQHNDPKGLEPRTVVVVGSVAGTIRTAGGIRRPDGSGNTPRTDDST